MLYIWTIWLICGTHTAHPRFAKNARRMEVRNEWQSFLSAYFKKYSHRSRTETTTRDDEQKYETRERERARARGVLLSVPYRQCLPIIANAEKRFLYVSLSSALGLARLGSSRLVSDRLDSFSFVSFFVSSWSMARWRFLRYDRDYDCCCWGWEWGWGRVSFMLI